MTALYTLETYILSDEQLKDAVPMEYLSHADKYAEDLRKSCLLMHKLADSPAGQVQTLRWFESPRKFILWILIA